LGLKLRYLKRRLKRRFKKLYGFLTDLSHALLGVLIVVLTKVNPLASILLFLAFLVYELDEDWHISDQAYNDILELMVGMVISSIVYLIYIS
jgi:hypothetical protein